MLLNVSLIVPVLLVSLSVLRANGSPVTNNSSTDEERICVSKDRLEFEKYFQKHDKPEVPDGACSEGISRYLGWDAALTVCLHGYARHSNGRCYKIVDVPKDGGAVKKHEYRIVYRGECEWLLTEVRASDLAPGYTLDLCDEDGGCATLNAEEENRGVAPLDACIKGMVNVDGRCVKVVKGLTGSGNRNPKTQGR